MIKLLKKYVRDEQGATAIEYGLIAAGIGMAIVITVGLVGGDIDATFVSIQTFL